MRARLIAVGLASARQLEGDEHEQRLAHLALAWPYAVDDLDALGSVLGRLQYHDVEREDLARLYRRYDELMQAFTDLDLIIVCELTFHAMSS